ncbi:hypothetical protein GOP47_0012338 [Adiantum capillus-veneris]|uniref:Uncharacterized protein n=1 Tax=Adiantum capillus-veneris TaxID=13818 RepID=A0A9D4ZFK8_ADICA|nr:hypothetical protein GOP47_0012338 [Adiantum capillus-veneris]
MLNIKVEFSLKKLESALLTPNTLLDTIHITFGFCHICRKAGQVNQALAAIHELKQHFKQSIHSKTDQEHVGMAVASKSKEAEVLAQRIKVCLLEAKIHDLQEVVMHISPA